MGKEQTGLGRERRVERSFGFASKSYIQWVIARQWANPISFTSSADLSHDGHVNVTVKEETRKIKTVFRGLKQSGNTYKQLFKLLKAKKIVSRRRNVGLFIRRGFVWEPVNDDKASFNSGSCILAVVKRNIIKIK
eukprot:TRINITY_DN9668_c0_g1_i5.p1 TRINITY_DN9668_c0_g1~~TRINITY_DN9668_c0_g1_i5.p1  ORF type:complete len:135 (+),score=33.77 TRINITY_DN9668_c0_g1_i5:209-613(+)